eukprot:10560116-Lingulodinium_polyedra.AAC.1
MDKDSVASRIKDFARGHRVLTRDEQKQAMQLAEGLSDYLESKCLDLVQGSEGRALVFNYSNDGTPVLCRQTT